MQRLPEVKVSMHALGIERFSAQLIEAAEQPRNVLCQRRGDPGSLMQPVHHDHRRPRAQHFCCREGRAESVVNLGKSSTQCLGLGCEAGVGLDLGRRIFGSQRLQRQVPAIDRACQLLDHHCEISVELPPVGDPAALDPTEQTCDIGDASGIERGMHFNIEVVAQFQTTEQLQDRYLTEHHRGVALLPCKGSRLKIGADARYGGGIEPGLAVRTAELAAGKQGTKNHSACFGILSGVVSNDRSKIRIGEAPDFCMMQLSVRSGTV